MRGKILKYNKYLCTLPIKWRIHTCIQIKYIIFRYTNYKIEFFSIKSCISFIQDIRLVVSECLDNFIIIILKYKMLNLYIHKFLLIKLGLINFI